MLLLLITAFALSADGFAAGLSFGLRGVRIGAGAKITIALLSLLFAMAAVTMGTAANAFLPNGIEQAIGAGILLVMGTVTAVHALLPDTPPKSAADNHKACSLNRTISVVRDPSQGDLDDSGTIDLKEAFLLGFSLSVDMLGAGIGLAISGIHPLWLLPPLVGTVQIFCLAAGELVGRQAHFLHISKRTLMFLSGLLLAVLGLVRLFC